MKEVELLNGPIEFDGAIDLRVRPFGVQPVRLPEAELGFHDEFTRFVACTPGSTRLRFRSTTRSLELRVSQRRIQLDEPRPAVYDLVIDGALAERRQSEAGEVIHMESGSRAGEPETDVRFNGLGEGRKEIELWLPQFASVFVSRLSIDDGAAIESAPDPRPRWIAHGSSITHCAEAAGPTDTWPAVAARLADLRLLGMGFGGSCLISAQVARVIRDEPADVISLKLGINVHPEGLLKARTFADSVHGFLSIVREGHPRTPLLVASPIFSPERENRGDAGGLSLVEMRELLRHAVERRREAGDEHITYLDGLELFGPADVANLPDGLHPDADGYRTMGERFYRMALAPGQPLALAR